MVNYGKFSILGINIHAVDYDQAINWITSAALEKKSFTVSALAVHGVMTGFLDTIHARRLNGLNLVVPDGQPVRWALKWLYGKKLLDRVYGPNLTIYTAEAMANLGLGIYLYGSTEHVLEKFVLNLKARFPKLVISGSEFSKFRSLKNFERKQLVERIKASGASAVFVGLGCPRQEVWAFEYGQYLNMPILAVGAAFDFHAGTLSQAPAFLQKIGFEWFYRLIQEPKRLWRRYLVLNPLYLWHLSQQKINNQKFIPKYPSGNEPIKSYG